MTTIIINENTEEGRSLMNVIRALRRSSDAVVRICDDTNDESFEVNTMDEELFERIPDMPYTKEERIASVRKGMEDIRAGRTVSMEEMRAKHPRI